MSSAAPLLLALLLAQQAKAVKAADTKQQRCTAQAVVMEAENQTLRGKIAVRDIVMNRARKLGKSKCAVIRQPNQFSWYGKKPVPAVQIDEWEDVLSAKPVLSSDYLYFFRKDMQRPGWSRGMKCKIVGAHRFCREALTR